MSSRWMEIRELTRVRVLLFLREKEAVFWVVFFPMVLAAVLGFAFRSAGLKPSQVTVQGSPDDPRVVELVRTLERVDLMLVEVDADPERARLDLRNGRIDVLIVPGDPDDPDDPGPLLHLDPIRPDVETARLRVLRALRLGLYPDDPEPVVLAPMTEKGSRYIDFLFPGLLGMNLMGTGMWSIGFAVADLRQRKVLKRFLVTPMRRSSFLLSFLFSRLVFLLLEVVTLCAFGAWVLDVPFRSGVAPFLILCVVGAVVFAGLGLLAAARAKTIEGVSGMLNLAMVPMWLCSGVFFSYERFPEVLHPVIRLLPLTALNDALRELMLDGSGLGTIASELVVQLAWGVISFLVALRVFRWQ